MTILPTATSADIRDRVPACAVMPIGSFEQHGEFLPLATDTFVAGAIAECVAKAYEVLLLPPQTISCSHEHAAWPGTVSIRATTLAAVVRDVAESLEHRGIRRMVLINGHGGNYVLSNVVQEMCVDEPRMALYPGSADWLAARTHAGISSSGHDDMHAGELETSILLHSFPHLVRQGNENADHEARDRPHLLTLGMSGYTTTGVIGSPSRGTAEKGRLVLESLTASFAKYLRVLGVGDE